MVASRALFCVLSSALLCTSICGADASPEEVVASAELPFAGKVVGSRVRMRLGPDLGAPVVDLLEEGTYLIVRGEEGEFYAVAPPEETSAFIYRPYVLDGIVEGSHVNVRLSPDVDAPILAQLNTGDPVCGETCVQNSRWMEIAIPDSARFYVAKDYLENAGGIELVTQRSSRREAVAQLLQDVYVASEEALAGPVSSVDIESLRAGFARVGADYPDFPEYAVRADTFLEMVEQLVEQRQLAVAASGEEPKEAALTLDELGQLAFGGQPVELIEIPLTLASDTDLESPLALARPAVERDFATDKMLVWEPVETGLYEVWAMDQLNASLDTFYEEQMLDGVVLSGIVEAYDRPVRNRPGDYLLVKNGRPVAFLYSTRVNLEEMVGQEASIRGLPRPNHNFAFPAYFVLAKES